METTDFLLFANTRNNDFYARKNPSHHLPLMSYTLNVNFVYGPRVYADV